MPFHQSNGAPDFETAAPIAASTSLNFLSLDEVDAAAHDAPLNTQTTSAEFQTTEANAPREAELLAPEEAPFIVTWTALVKREPRLDALYKDLRAVRDEGGASFCANKVWYVKFEPRLINLVGARAELADAMLRSPHAYTLARRMLYSLLPDCRNCVCVPW